MAKIMIYGTTSSAGKSTIATAMCRYYRDKGYKVCPFKSQNMSRNSFKLQDGKLISNAQAIQAYAAGIEADEYMNPILLVPSSDTGSDVYVLGKLYKHMNTKEYYSIKKELKAKVKEVFEELEKKYDVMIIEGAGSPAEINLLEDDFVNTGMAELADTNAIIVADIDKGGVFASIYGTYMILDEKDRSRIKGYIINKFRGDASLLDEGIKKLHELTGLECLGIVPYTKLEIADEDSLHDYEKAVNAHMAEHDAMNNEIDRLAEVFEEAIDIDKLNAILGL